MTTALITGASGGIGSGIARYLDSQGYHLYLVDIKKVETEELASQLHSAEAIVADLANPPDLAALCDQIMERLEPLDIGFVNAGTVIPGNLTDTSFRSLDLQLDINLRSSMHIIKALVANMMKGGHGHVIATVSMGGIIPLKGSSVYTATKFGLRGFLASIRDELHGSGISISGIYPSAVDTPLLRYEAVHNGTPLNFLGKPKTVDDVVKAFRKALKKKRLEIYVPYFDSIQARLVCFFPWLLRRVYPVLERKGEKGRRKFIEKHGLKKEEQVIDGMD